MVCCGIQAHNLQVTQWWRHTTTLTTRPLRTWYNNTNVWRVKSYCLQTNKLWLCFARRGFSSRPKPKNIIWNYHKILNLCTFTFLGNTSLLRKKKRPVASFVFEVYFSTDFYATQCYPVCFLSVYSVLYIIKTSFGENLIKSVDITKYSC